MRPLIKRSLFALATAGLVLGLSACGHNPFGGEGRGDGRGDRGHQMGMGHGHSEADMQKRRDKMIERATSELSLDATQKAKLVTLMDTLQAKRAAMMGSHGAAHAGGGAASGPQGMKGHEGHGGPGMVPRAEMQALIKGDKFDRAGAQALIDQKANALRSASPEVITAMGDFYDSLKPEQQAKVRAFMERGPMRRGMMGGHRG